MAITNKTMLVLKLTAVLFFAACLQASAEDKALFFFRLLLLTSLEKYQTIKANHSLQ